MSSALVRISAPVAHGNPVPLVTPALRYRLSFVSLTPENVDILKSLNLEIFPVSYPDAYYTLVVRPELLRFCKLSEIGLIPL
jgi:hypothetical protein